LVRTSDILQNADEGILGIASVVYRSEEADVLSEDHQRHTLIS
jgi:hypothetical protein